MSELAEKKIREYAHSYNLEKWHLQYQMTSNNRPDLINHNGYYGNLIYFIQAKCLEEYNLSPGPFNSNFEQYFIDKLLSL